MNRLAILALATTLAGCGTYLPELTNRGTLPLEVLVAKIDCEFQVAVWVQKYVKHRSFLAEWQGQYAVTIKSNEIGSTKAATNTFPFLPAKNLAVNATVGGGETTTANRTALMKFNLSFDSVTREPTCAKVSSSSLHPFITGRIGFEEWMNRAFDGADVGGRIQIGQPQPISSLGHTFEFSIDVNANAGAGFVIGPAPTIGINPAATIDRLDDGIIDVAIAKPAVDPLPQLITALTKEEKELIAELKQLIEKKQAEVRTRTAELALPANKDLIARFSNVDRMTIQRIAPTDEQKQQELRLNKQEIERAQSLIALENQNQADEQTIRNYQIEAANMRPQVSIVTKPRILPPDRNPEIANTFQQLTLERLNNNLRVTVP